MTRAMLKERSVGMSADMLGLFSRIRLEDYRVRDFELLCQLYDTAKKLDADFLNKTFGLSLTAEGWGALSEEMCSFFVCGLNVQSLPLLCEAITTTTLTAPDSVKKSEEYLDKMNEILADVECLLNTIRPIGDVL